MNRLCEAWWKDSYNENAIFCDRIATKGLIFEKHEGNAPIRRVCGEHAATFAAGFPNLKLIVQSLGTNTKSAKKR